MKKGKKHKIMSQHDESFNGAVSYDDKEAQGIIDSKIKERIRFQADLRNCYLACMYSQVELSELIDIYNGIDANNDEGIFITKSGEKIHGQWKFKKEKREIITRDKDGKPKKEVVDAISYGYIETDNGKEVKAKDIHKTVRLGAVADDKIPKNPWGLTYSKELLRWEIEIKQHRLAELVSKLNHMIQEIRKLGFSKEQIDAVKYNGKYIKDQKLLEEMEEKWFKENNPEVGEEDD